MFGLLVRNENLEVVEVALAVVAPWPLELLVEVGVPLALLRHRGGCVGGEGRCVETGAEVHTILCVGKGKVWATAMELE